MIKRRTELCMYGVPLLLLLYFLHLVTSMRDHYFYEEISAQLSRKPRYVVFPKGTAFEITAILQFPLDIPKQDVAIGVNIQVSYDLPENATELKFPFYTTTTKSLKTVDKRHAYEQMETMVSRNGYNGRSCVLRMICEVNETPLVHNGIVGEVLHLIFTPSTLLETHDSWGVDNEFIVAQKLGEERADCESIYSECSLGLLDLISIISY